MSAGFEWQSSNVLILVKVNERETITNKVKRRRKSTTSGVTLCHASNGRRWGKLGSTDLPTLPSVQPQMIGSHTHSCTGWGM